MINLMAEDKFPTGVVELDRLLGGGVHRGVNILVKGATGTGKTTFALQFLVDGASRGERGMYFTFEESGDQVIKYGSKFFPGLSTHLKSKVLQIIDFTTRKTGDAKMVQGDKVIIPSKQVVNSTAYIEDRILDIRGQTIQRVVIDGLQTFATTFYDLSGQRDVEELRRTLSKILLLLKNEGITTYVVSEEAEEQQDKYGFINFTADGIFVLRVNEALDVRTMKIMKMRGINHTLKPLTMQLTEGGGVTLIQHQQYK